MSGEVVFELGEGQVLVDDLGHLVARLHGEREVGDDAECAERDDRAGKALGVAFAGERVDLAIGADELERGDGGREISVVHARAVGGRGAGSGDRNVRQRGEVVQGEAGAVELQGEVRRSGYQRQR